MLGPFQRLAVAFALPWLTVVAISQSISPPESDDGRQWLDSRTPAPSPIAVASHATENAEPCSECALRHLASGYAGEISQRDRYRTGVNEGLPDAAKGGREAPARADDNWSMMHDLA